MQKLCTQCLYIGEEESKIYGDYTTDSILWGIAFFFALMGAFETFLWFPATIMFFIALLYTLSGYTFKACVCSKCHKPSMIPLKSDKAQQIIAQNSLASPDYIDINDERTIWGMAFRTFFILLTLVLVLYMLYKHFS